MKRWSFPSWLLRDVPALLAVLARFWPLAIFMMTSGSKAMRAGTGGKPLRDHIALLLAFAEAHLDFALWRQAYRRLGWDPRTIVLHTIAPPVLWSDKCERMRGYAQAFRNMNHIVVAYVEDLRRRYGISDRELVSHDSTDVRLPRAAHHDLVGVSPFQRSPLALILSSARSARPSKDERGHTRARGPLLNHTQNQEPPTAHVNARDSIAVPTAC